MSLHLTQKNDIRLYIKICKSIRNHVGGGVEILRALAAITVV